jgi:hypothetical protein
MQSYLLKLRPIGTQPRFESIKFVIVQGGNRMHNAVAIAKDEWLYHGAMDDDGTLLFNNIP